MALKMDPSLGMPAAQVARAYLPSMEGTRHGKTIDPHKLAADKASPSGANSACGRAANGS